MIKDEDEEFVRLMKFISSEDKEEMKMLSKYQEELIEVIHIMDTLTDDDEQWYEYLGREKFLREQVTIEYERKQQEEKIAELQEKMVDSELRGMVKVLLMMNKSDDEIIEMAKITTSQLEKIKGQLKDSMAE